MKEELHWFLIKKNVPVNLELINKKLEYYNMCFDRDRFIANLMNKKRIWEKELHPLVTFVPDFEKSALDGTKKMGLVRFELTTGESLRTFKPVSPLEPAAIPD